MWWKWADRVQPRPNVRVHPLDAYEVQLRGEVEERDERAESIVVLLFAGLVLGGILGLILVVA